MTGYGKGEAIDSLGKFSVEIRSVNHRYGEVNIKLPRQLLALETEIKRRVTERCKRGKIDLFITFETPSGSAQLPTPNIPMAEAYYEAFETIYRYFNYEQPVPLNIILSQKDVLTTTEATTDIEAISEALFKVLDSALESFDSMRLKEGNTLAADVKQRMALVASLVNNVAERALLAVTANRERLKERIDKLLGDIEKDEARFTQEAAFMADRMDITEELVRLGSHMAQFGEVIDLSESVGRKLDFLLQEMNREVNTIGSKANDSDIAKIVVELKAEMEKIREQVQNIE